MQCHIAHCTLHTAMVQYGMVCIAHNSHYFLSIFAMFNHLMLVNVIFLSCPIQQLSQAHFKCENVCISCIECNQFNRIMQNICRMYFSCTNYTSVNKNGHKKIHRRKAASISSKSNNKSKLILYRSYMTNNLFDTPRNYQNPKWNIFRVKIHRTLWMKEWKKEETGGERNEKVTRRITRAPTNRINQRR